MGNNKKRHVMLRQYWKRHTAERLGVKIQMLEWVDGILIYLPDGEPVEGVPHIPKPGKAVKIVVVNKATKPSAPRQRKPILESFLEILSMPFSNGR